MRFLIDAQLPPALALQLAAAGHEAAHVTEIGHGGATDADIWSHAISTKSVIVSKDGDFAILAKGSRPGPQVLWVRLGNVSNKALWSALEPLLPEIVEALEAGEQVIEIA